MKTTICFWSTSPEFNNKGWLLQMAFANVIEALADDRFGFTVNIESQAQLALITESVPEGWEMAVSGEPEIPAQTVHRYRGAIVG